MHNKVHHSETTFSLGICLILSLVTIVMAIMLTVQLVDGPLGSKPAPDWVLILLTAVFCALTLNFSFIRLSLTDAGVTVRYGIFKKSLAWKDVRACLEDNEAHFVGWGIRYGRFQSRPVWIFNVIGGPRVAFVTESTKPAGLIVSTRNPALLVQTAAGLIRSGNP